MAYTATQEKAFEAIAAQLRAYAGVIQPPGGPIDYHGGKDIKLPLDPTKMELVTARDTIDRVIEAESTYNDFSYTFDYRPGDGAVAVNTVLKTLYGSVLGKKTWFQDPELMSVEVAPDVKVSVPWGLLQLPAIPFGSKATLYVTSTRHPVFGTVLHLGAKALKSAQGEMDALFDMVRKELVAHSIYRGQAITASEVPQFIDVAGVRPDNIVYAELTGRRLDFRLFSVIEKEHIYKQEGDDGKKIVWLYGDYGTGKTETAKRLAKLAVDNGWGFCQVRAGVDTFDTAMQMAKLYAPRMVVFVEDAETMAGANEAKDVSKMLDQLDGTEAKLLKQCLFVFTTNFIDKVSKGATRFGRADAIIRLGNLDRPGCERLAQVELGDKLAADVDYDAVYAAMGGAVLTEGGLPERDERGRIIFKPEADLTPAFMRQAFNTAKMAASLQRGPRHKVSTTDILDGIADLEEQLNIHRAAPEARPREGLGQALVDALRPMVVAVVQQRLNEYAQVIYDQAHQAADSVVEHRIHGAAINREENGSTWARIATN